MIGWTKEMLAAEIVRLAAPDSDPNSTRGQKIVAHMVKTVPWDKLADRFHENVLAWLEVDCEWKESLFADAADKYGRVYQNA
jgi:hypothetical protein